MPVIDGGEKVVRVLCIYYLVQFQEDQGQKKQEQVRALFDSGSKVNAMNPAFTQKLGLYIQKTNVGAQKIDGSTLETFEMVITNFQVEDKGNRPRFFQKTILVANTKFEMILGMLFLKISNTNVVFGKETLIWKFYATNKALSTTNQVQLVDPKKFVIAALDTDSKTFIIYVVIWKQKKMPMYFKKQAQVRALLFDKTPTEVPAEYFDYSNVFSAENAAELPENTGINEHAIKQKDGK